MGHRKHQALSAFMPELKVQYFIQSKHGGPLIIPYGERRYAEEVLHLGDKIVKRKKR